MLWCSQKEAGLSPSISLDNDSWITMHSLYMLFRHGEALFALNPSLISDPDFPALSNRRIYGGYPQNRDLLGKSRSVLSLCRLWSQPVQVEAWPCHLLADWSWANCFLFLCLGPSSIKRLKIRGCISQGCGGTSMSMNSTYKGLLKAAMGAGFPFALVAMTLVETSLFPLGPWHGWPGVLIST